MTVVFGRSRRRAVRPSPIPARVNKRGYMGGIGVIPLFAPVMQYTIFSFILSCSR